MTKIAIHGFYGHGNLGDSAVLHSLLREFKKINGIKVIVFSTKPREVTRNYGIKSINSHVKRWDLLNSFRIIYEIKNSDLFLLGGGGLLKDYGSDSSNVEHWLKLLRLAKKWKRKTALGAIGVENIRFETSRKLIREALNGVDLITVRDKESRHILQTIGVEEEINVISDPALLLYDSSNLIQKKMLSPMNVSICVRHWYDEGFYIKNPQQNKKFLGTVSAAADFLVEQYDAVIDFIPLRITSYDNDILVAQKIVSDMKFKKNINIHKNVPGIYKFIKMIERSTFVIGMRLHSLIIAASLGIPIIGLEYMPKVAAFMNSIEQNKYSLNLKTIDSYELIELIDNTLKNYEHRSKAILLKVTDLQRITREGISDLVNLAEI